MKCESRGGQETFLCSSCLMWSFRLSIESYVKVEAKWKCYIKPQSPEGSQACHLLWAEQRPFWRSYTSYRLLIFFFKLRLNSSDWTSPFTGMCNKKKSKRKKAIWRYVIVNMMVLLFSFELKNKLWPITHFKHYLANSAVLRRGLLNKFLQIPLATTAHNQACHFPRNRRVVKITAFEEWKFYTVSSLFGSHLPDSVDIWQHLPIEKGEIPAINKKRRRIFNHEGRLVS